MALILHHNHFWAPGGVERIIDGVIAQMPEHQHVLWVCDHAYLPHRPPDVERFVVSETAPADIIRECDVFHCHTPWAFQGHSGEVLRAAENKTVYTLHTLIPDDPLWGRMVSGASIVTAVSPVVKRHVEGLYHRDGIVVVPPGVSMERKCRNSVSNANQLGVPMAGVFGVLWVGRIGDREKNLPAFLDAIELLQDCPRLHALVVGDSYLSRYTTGNKPAIIARMAELPNVTWIPYLPPAYIQMAYEWADVVVSTSVSEGFGMALVEGMLHECVPVVASGDVGMLHLVPIDIRQKICDEDIANTLRGLYVLGDNDIIYGSSKLLEMQKACSHSVVAGHWSEADMASAYNRLYEGVLSSA